jgi:hypothetical protein
MSSTDVTFKGVCAYTALHTCATVQQWIINGLYFVSANYSKNRQIKNKLGGNLRLTSAGIYWKSVLDTISPKAVWDFFSHTRNITKASVRAKVTDLGLDSNAMPLLTKQQNRRVVSEVLALDCYLKIEFNVDDRFVFEAPHRELELDHVPEDDFWLAATGRMERDPNRSGLVNFRTLTIKPAHLQEFNTSNVLTSEEVARGLRVQFQASVRGASVDAGLANRLNKCQRILPDTFSLMGQVVENTWCTTVYNSAPLYLK